MVFSLFSRSKDKSDSRRTRGAAPVRILENTLCGPATMPSLDAQRELARRTAEKIDRIESEMIDRLTANDRSDASTQPVTRPAIGAILPDPRSLVPPEARLAPIQTPTPAPTPELLPLEFDAALPGRPDGVAGIEVASSSLAPDLEEAAILYANGLAAAAAATLRASIVRAESGASGQQAWRMLLDVLQALGVRADFEAVAIDFAARFETSPPAWQDVPERAPKRALTATSVVIPATLDARVATQFELAQRACANRRPVQLDFRALREVDAPGAALAVAAFAAFQRSGGEVTVTGADALFGAARAAIEPGRRDSDDACWQLGLLALRLLGDQPAFDDLAIEFCVTYELSPPSWEPLPGAIRTASSAPQAAPAETPAAPPPSAVDGGAFALRGEIAGRMLAELDALRAFAADRSEVGIDCRALRRLDFVAAGELLNEVATLVGSGHRVVFVEPSPVVEALMTVMGLHELAEIRRRRI